MQYKVTNKQPNSKWCFACGLENQFGLKSRFYQLESGVLVALFTPSFEHQGYPGRLHGGLAATILDETIGRTVLNHHETQVWGVTLEFSMKFRKPVPLDQQIKVIARVTGENKRTFTGAGEIVLSDGSVAIEGSGRYLKMDLSKITDVEFTEEQWLVVGREADDPVAIDCPDGHPAAL